MWESVLKKQEWELQVNSERKAMVLNISKNSAVSEVISVRFSQTELFELMHTFLSINRSFNNESMYFEVLESEETAS